MENVDCQKIKKHHTFVTLKLAPSKMRKPMYYAIDRETEEILNLLHRLEHQCDAPPGTIEDGLKELSWALEGPVSMVALVQYILDHGDKEKAKQIRKERQCIRKRYERYSIT